MAKIVLATFGSLGDLHPKIALGLELRRRGHAVSYAVMEAYREKMDALGFPMSPLRPNLDPEDKAFARSVMDLKTGTEKLVREILMPNLRPMYEDLTEAVKRADLLITGEVIYPASSLVEKTGIRWISTSLAPVSFLSAHDPLVPPIATWAENLRFLGAGFHQIMFAFMRGTIKSWYEPYRKFRRELGLSEDHDPIFDDKFSSLLHLALFSKVLAKPQPDWHSPTLQAGFCFYDGQDDLGKMPEDLQKFLDAGEPPIVFTLGSAASMDAGEFFNESARAAQILKRRAVLIYGIFGELPRASDPSIGVFDYAPYSEVFPRSACVVHQGGVGTTGQVLRAGVPHLIMPYSHDQPDNAARCRRVGVARVISRERYRAETAARELREILGDKSYRVNAAEAKRTVDAEHGTRIACDAIEDVLRR